MPAPCRWPLPVGEVFGVEVGDSKDAAAANNIIVQHHA
jgi:hypothetical protein